VIVVLLYIQRNPMRCLLGRLDSSSTYREMLITGSAKGKFQTVAYLCLLKWRLKEDRASVCNYAGMEVPERANSFG